MLTGRVARSAGYGLLAGGLVALLTAVLAVLAGGALGPGYLAAVGPSGWQVAAALAVEVAVPAAVTAALVPARGAVRAGGSTESAVVAGTPAAKRSSGDGGSGDGGSDDDGSDDDGSDDDGSGGDGPGDRSRDDESSDPADAG